MYFLKTLALLIISVALAIFCYWFAERKRESPQEHRGEGKEPHEAIEVTSENLNRLNNLFEIALVLITVLGAAGFGFVAVTKKDPSDIKYYFWIFTYPIVVLIVAWVMKELISGRYEVPQDAYHVRIANFIRQAIIFLTEFCWYFWATILIYFLNIFFYLLTEKFYYVMIILTAIVYVILIDQIKSAYVRAVGRDYYTPIRKWGFTAIGVILSIFLMYLYTLLHFA